MWHLTGFKNANISSKKYCVALWHISPVYTPNVYNNIFKMLFCVKKYLLTRTCAILCHSATMYK